MLVVDHRQGVALRRELGDRPDEVAPGRAVHPGGAHDVGGRTQREHGLLAGEFGPPVRRTRRGGGIGLVGLVRRAVEDIVGGDVHQGCADLGTGCGQLRRSGGIGGISARLVGLGTVDVRPGRGVDHHETALDLRGPSLVRDDRPYPGSIGDVELGAGETRPGKDPLITLQLPAEVHAELTAGSRHHHAHQISVADIAG